MLVPYENQNEEWRLNMKQEDVSAMKNRKVALVTGSSKGIGRAIAARLGQEDYITFVTYRTDQMGGELTCEGIRKNRGTAHLVPLDACSEDDARRVLGNIQADYGHMDFLVKNAGIEIPKCIEDCSYAEFQAVVST